MNKSKEGGELPIIIRQKFYKRKWVKVGEMGKSGKGDKKDKKGA